MKLNWFAITEVFYAYTWTRRCTLDNTEKWFDPENFFVISMEVKENLLEHFKLLLSHIHSVIF